MTDLTSGYGDRPATGGFSQCGVSRGPRVGQRVLHVHAVRVRLADHLPGSDVRVVEIGPLLQRKHAECRAQEFPTRYTFCSSNRGRRKLVTSIVSATMLSGVLLLSGSTRNGSTNTAVLCTALAIAPQGVSGCLHGGLADLPGVVPGDDIALAQTARRGTARGETRVLGYVAPGFSRLPVPAFQSAANRSLPTASWLTPPSAIRLR